MLGTLRQALDEIDPEMPVFQPLTLEQNVRASFVQQRMTAILLAAFSMVALVLAVVGLYGVMSGYVGPRVREFGVRMAMGADRGSILSMVMRRGMLLAPMLPTTARVCITSRRRNAA